MFLCPSGGFNTKATTLNVAGQDCDIRSGRTLVENSYSRIKGKWKILKGYSRSKENLGAILYVTTALTNIDTQFTAPFRAKCCEDGSCFLCRWAPEPVID